VFNTAVNTIKVLSAAAVSVGFRLCVDVDR